MGPILEYASPAWDTNSENFVEKNTARFKMNYDNRGSKVTNMIKELKLGSLN